MHVRVYLYSLYSIQARILPYRYTDTMKGRPSVSCTVVSDRTLRLTADIGSQMACPLYDAITKSRLSVLSVGAKVRSRNVFDRANSFQGVESRSVDHFLSSSVGTWYRNHTSNGPVYTRNNIQNWMTGPPSSTTTRTSARYACL